MTFETAAARSASLLLAVAAALAGCGGGGEQGAPAAPNGTVTLDSASLGDAQSESAASTETAAVLTADAAVAAAASVDAVADTVLDAVGSSDSAPTVASVETTASLTVAASTSSHVDTQVAAATGAVQENVIVAARSGVGINLTGISPYSAEMPTIDLMKKASPWLTQCTPGGNCADFRSGASGYDTLEEAQLDLDPNGWVKSLPSASDATLKFRTVMTKLAESAVQQAGNYTVLYDGSGTIAYSGAGKKVAALSSAGRDIVAVTNSDNNPLFLYIKATNPENYLRNIRVYPPGGACQNDLSTYAASEAACTSATGKFISFEHFPAGEIWHPAFLSGTKKFRSIRFMDWGRTNATPVVNWTERTPVASRTWNTTAGVPIESMFDLAAKVGADPWMNIPPYASDAYVRSFAQLAHAHLGSDAKLALEYGNEMWNYSFNATKWAAAQSKTFFATQTAAGANAGVLQMNWYAMRLAQVCQIVKTEFGADASRVQCVANTQAANSWSTDQVLKCTYAASLLGKPCAKYFDAIAIAPYFGYYIGNSATNSTVSAWTADSDGGLSKMFLEMTGVSAEGKTATPLLAALNTGANTGALSQVAGWMKATKTVATAYGLPMWAYEGGQGLIPSNDLAVMNLMFAANRDARMGSAYQTMLTDWKNAGGGTFMLFADVGKYAKSGMWGLRESQFDESAPKWKTAVKWRDTVPCWWAGC
jgi:hypothetical protein